MPVTEQTLLRGAWYALEQAGRLLDSSVVLIDAGHFSTATGIAMLAREELGRYKLLRQLARNVANGRVMSADDVRSECNDHEDKQRAATLSTMLRPQAGSALASALLTVMNTSPGSPEWEGAGRVIADATKVIARRAPSDRHRLRTNSFYVDLQPSGTDWSRPSDIQEQKARDAVDDAVNDYSIQRNNLLNVERERDSQMLEAAKSIIPSPELPLPRWPKFG